MQLPGPTPQTDSGAARSSQQVCTWHSVHGDHILKTTPLRREWKAGPASKTPSLNPKACRAREQWGSKSQGLSIEILGRGRHGNTTHPRAPSVSFCKPLSVLCPEHLSALLNRRLAGEHGHASPLPLHPIKLHIYLLKNNSIPPAPSLAHHCPCSLVGTSVCIPREWNHTVCGCTSTAS